jgi:molybdopterin synthase sulfur carrier subunit
MRPALNLVYLAALGQQLGLQQETLTPPEAILTLGQLRQWLVARGPLWQALDAPQVQMAMNFELAQAHHALIEGAEIAFFPPVTGG